MSPKDLDFFLPEEFYWVCKDRCNLAGRRGGSKGRNMNGFCEKLLTYLTEHNSCQYCKLGDENIFCHLFFFPKASKLAKCHVL